MEMLKEKGIGFVVYSYCKDNYTFKYNAKGYNITYEYTGSYDISKVIKDTNCSNCWYLKVNMLNNMEIDFVNLINMNNTKGGNINGDRDFRL